MREILFRGKRVDNGEWAYGSLITETNPFDKDMVMTHIYDNGFNEILVDPRTIGQYTGLKDKNGTRIFEGDVCKAYICKAADTVEKEVVGVICFEDGTFEFKCEHENIYLYPLVDVLEVIGNVFDNPDFLEVKQ